MKKLHHEGVAGEMGEIAMDLFYQLQEPGTDKDGVSEEEKRSGARQQYALDLRSGQHRDTGGDAEPPRESKW